MEKGWVLSVEALRWFHGGFAEEDMATVWRFEWLLCVTCVCSFLFIWWFGVIVINA